MPHRLIASILTIASHSIASVNLHLLHLLVPFSNLLVFTLGVHRKSHRSYRLDSSLFQATGLSGKPIFPFTHLRIYSVNKTHQKDSFPFLFIFHPILFTIARQTLLKNVDLCSAVKMWRQLLLLMLLGYTKSECIAVKMVHVDQLPVFIHMQPHWPLIALNAALLAVTIRRAKTRSIITFRQAFCTLLAGQAEKIEMVIYNLILVIC